MMWNLSHRVLDACTVLYNSKLFPEAVYFLQQSVEKASKALVVYARDKPYTEKEFTDIGHKAIKIYKDWALAKKKVYENILKNKKILDIVDLEVDINNELNSANDMLAALSKIKTFNEKDLISIDIETESIFERYKDFEEQKNKTDWEKIKIYLLKASLLYGIDVKEKTNIENTLEKLRSKNGFEKWSQKMYMIEGQIHTCLPFLLIHTLSHEALTRYPKADLSITPKIYNEELQIVKKFVELADLQKKILEKLIELHGLKKIFSEKYAM